MQRPTTRLTRRSFLRLAGVTALGTLASAALQTQTVQGLIKLGNRRRTLAYWSDPRTWRGKVPGRNDVAVVSKRIVLDVDAHVRRVVVKRQGELVFHPRHSVTLRSDGNVVVRGRLTLRPKAPAILHQLLFPSVDESRFIGGGMRVIPSDIGLWVTGKGVLNIAGSPKLAWTTAREAIPAGSTSFVLREDPAGWRVGDEVVLTPTLSPSDPNFDIAYDISTVTAIDRLTRRITLGTPTYFEHPGVEVQPGVVLTAEVLNLTRNVRIEGTPGGRFHVWIRSSRRQRIGNASLRFTGPRRPRAPDPNFPPSSTEPVLGRYGFHFHMMNGASRGSIVKGVVIRESGSHAYVTHQSHGVTFRDCISHNTFEEAYWWDPSPDMHTPAPPTDDVLYDHCVASLVRADPPWWGLRTAGFFLGARNGNAIRNCVAVGVQGSVDSSGYIWPDASNGVWKFEDCLAHNNRMSGIFTWQNNDAAHVISHFTAYHNGWVGIDHGAYVSGFLYKDCVLYGNRFAAIEAHALSFSSPLQTFSRLRCDQAGLSPYCVVTAPHLAAPMAPVLFAQCQFRGHGVAAFGFVDQASPFPNLFSIVDCTFEGNEFWVGQNVHAATGIRVHDAAHGTITLRRADQPGELRPEWNARVNPTS